MKTRTSGVSGVVLAFSALLLACSQSPGDPAAQSPIGSGTSNSTLPTTSQPDVQSDEFEPLGTNIDLTAAATLPEGYVVGTRPAIPTFIADHVRSLANGDPDLLALADTIATMEQAAIDDLGTELDNGAGIDGLTPIAVDTTVDSSPATTAAPTGLRAPRGFAMASPTPALDSRPFASLGVVNSLLSGVFLGNIPPGATVTGTSPKSTSSEGGSTVTVGVTIDVQADGRNTFGLDAEVKVDKAATGSEPATKGSASVGFEVTANPCPAADGTVELKFRAKLGADVAAGAKSAIGTTEVSGTAVAHVDDSATVTGFDIDARQQTSGTDAAGKGTFVDSNFAVRVETSGDGTETYLTTPTLNRESQGVDFKERNRLHEDGRQKAEDFVIGYLAGLQLLWRDGKCVEVVAPSPGRVEPGTVSPIQVSVRHKQDGSALSVPVDATLSGPGSIDTNRIASAPGTITHTASNDKKSMATIELVSTSRRGIGRTTVTIEVGNVTYVASGGGSAISITGTVDDLTKPFTLGGQGAGFAVTFNYTPDAGGRSGAVAYSGAGGGAALAGSGTYGITGEDGGVLTLTASHSGCADIGTCQENTDVITLTPVP